jgi:hypothetical protein
MGRTEKTEHGGAAKNPRLLKACNITRNGDMGEFFFISMTMKLLQLIFYHAKKDNFLGLRAVRASNLCKYFPARGAGFAWQLLDP